MRSTSPIRGSLAPTRCCGRSTIAPCERHPFRDLGYTYSQPAIVRLQDGTWAAVFGNGYNNTVSGWRGQHHR